MNEPLELFRATLCRIRLTIAQRLPQSVKNALTQVNRFSEICGAAEKAVMPIPPTRYNGAAPQGFAIGRGDA
jgi:hypothetical protein